MCKRYHYTWPKILEQHLNFSEMTVWQIHNYLTKYSIHFALKQ